MVAVRHWGTGFDFPGGDSGAWIGGVVLATQGSYAWIGYADIVLALLALLALLAAGRLICDSRGTPGATTRTGLTPISHRPVKRCCSPACV